MCSRILVETFSELLLLRVLKDEEDLDQVSGASIFWQGELEFNSKPASGLLPLLHPKDHLRDKIGEMCIMQGADNLQLKITEVDGIWTCFFSWGPQDSGLSTRMLDKQSNSSYYGG